MQKIGYLGPEATFSHEAAQGYCQHRLPGEEILLAPFATKLDVLEAVYEGTADLGIVPIENSIEGTVSDTLEGLLRYGDLFILTDVVLSVSQNLMALPGASITGLREVWSHPQGIGQCRTWLHEHGVATTQFSSTAAAAKAVRDSARRDVAAISNRAAAEVFGLTILQSDLQDEQENRTRFVVVAKGSAPSTQAVKTMVLLTPCEERSGVLATILNVIAALSLNLAWIESRPTKRRLGTYQFFLDIEAGLQAEPLQKALHILKELGHDTRVLGSYDSVIL